MVRAWLAFAWISIACGGSGGDPTPEGPYVLLDVPEGGAAIPLAGIPYPSDLLLDSQGKIAVTIEALPFESDADPDVLQNVVDGLAAANGFGITTGAVFSLGNVPETDPVDQATITAERAQLVDLEIGTAIAVTPHVRTLDAQIHLNLPNGLVLDEGKRYAFVLRAGIATQSGAPVVPDPDLTAALGGGGATRVAEVYAPLATWLTMVGIDRTTVIGATVFRTASYRAKLEAARDALLDTPAPVAVIDRVIAEGPELDDLLGAPTDPAAPGWDNEGGIAHGNLAYVVLGHFPSPNYQSPSPGALGIWELGADGRPVEKSVEDVPFLLAIPRSGSISGLPVIVFQHGLNDNRDAALAVADAYAARGYATFSVDIPFHGDRYPDRKDDFHNVTGAAGGDGIADSSAAGGATYFFDIVGDPSQGITQLDARVISDSFRQAAIDVIAGVRLVREGDWSALAAADPGLAAFSIDPDGLVFTAESFGSMIGVLALSVLPGDNAAVLSVGGGGLLIDLLENSPTYWPIFGILAAGAFGLTPNDVDAAYDPAHTHLAFLMMQQLLEPGDPLTYAKSVVASPQGRTMHVALLAAFSDESVPNQSGEALAKAMGLSWVEVGGSAPGPRYVEGLPMEQAPVAGNLDGRTAAFVEIDPATHGMLTRQRGERRFQLGFPPFEPLAEPVPVDNPIREMIDLVLGFADDHRAGNVPAVVDTFGP